MEKRRVNLKRIAQKAGVDVSTVSRALSGSSRVKTETREQIVRLAQELDYRPNALARGLVTSRTRTIGIVVPEIKNAFYAGILTAAEQTLTQAGYSMLLGLSHYAAAEEKNCLDLFLSRSVDGLIVFSGELPQLVDYWRRATDSPLVMMDYKFDAMQTDVVTCDNARGVELGVEHLTALGHRDIAFVTDEVTAGIRLNAFLAAMSARGLNGGGHVLCSPVKYEQGGYEAAMQLMSADSPPTAIFCMNDYMALGALKALSDLDLSVPEDVSVVGFDDSTLLDYLVQSLTTVRQPKYSMGEKAAAILLSRIGEQERKNHPEPIQKLLLQPELVVRGTTGPCAG